MQKKKRKKNPEIVVRDGKPTVVILDIEDYREMLERLEDLEDLEMLEQMRVEKLEFRSLDDFLKEYRARV